MVLTYTTTELVQAEIRDTTPFSNSTNPSIQSVNRWIDETQAMIDQWAGFVASELTHTEYIDYTGAEYINMKHSPIMSVSALMENTNSLGSDLGETYITKTQSTDYFVYNDSGQILINFERWNPIVGPRKLKLVYTSGYEDVPVIHQAIATKIVAERVLSSLLNNNVNESSDGGSVSVGSISIVEPGAYGVQNYQRLKTDIEDLKKKLLQGTGVFRYTAG